MLRRTDGHNEILVRLNVEQLEITIVGNHVHHVVRDHESGSRELLLDFRQGSKVDALALDVNVSVRHIRHGEVGRHGGNETGENSSSRELHLVVSWFVSWFELVNLLLLEIVSVLGCETKMNLVGL